MSQRTRILTDILGFDGWQVAEAYFEWPDGRRADIVPRGLRCDLKLVVRLERRWRARCSGCGAVCRGLHGRLGTRRWRDLPWAGRPVEIEADPVRVKCRRCGSQPVEMLAWAEPYQRQSARLQQHLALQAASMPVMHVAVLHGLSWATVRRAEGDALARWDATRTAPPLRYVGVDEKFLGRRHRRSHRFVTIASNLETGEPVWIGYGRGTETLGSWLQTLDAEAKARIQLFAMDMHRPFELAVRGDPGLAHAVIAHDPFHVMKRAGEALNEVRKDTFFRAGAELRGVGRGTRWLIQRSWERSSPLQRNELRKLFAYNHQLARAYQIVEELRHVLRYPNPRAMSAGLDRVLRRTRLRRHRHLRRLHDSLRAHRDAILALGKYRPATGRIEALNNNWETLVRRGRGYRDLPYMFLKLRFMTANPVRTVSDIQRFLALGVTPPTRKAA